MTVTLHPTGAWTDFEGLHLQIWRGATDTGIHVLAYLSVAAVHPENEMPLREELDDAQADSLPMPVPMLFANRDTGR